MKRAVLVCNGSLTTGQAYANISKNDFIVAVDGGANKLVKTGFVPRIIIGDMDSINRAALRKFRQCEFIRSARDSDKLDLELALEYCVSKDFRRITILGSVSQRTDMTLANVFILSRIPSNVDARIIHNEQEIFLLRPGKTRLSGLPGERISLFPLNNDAKGLTLRGLKFPLNNFFMRFGVGRGLSNEFAGRKAEIYFKGGLLVCVHFRSSF